VITNSKIEEYIHGVIDPEDPLLYSLNRETNVRVLHPRMLTGHWQGQILSMISYMCNPRYILEIGTYTGYSSICLAKGLAEDGHLHTIEKNDEIVEIPLSYFERAGISHRISLHIGDALDIIPKLNETFDLVFIDAEKSEYLAYYHAIFDKVRKGGFILADNVLWSGKVLEHVEQGDHFTNGILEFTEYVKNDERVEKTMLPIRDGMMLLRKK
jgi:caffeoyl-CoA O-methyltransferase